MTTAPDLTRSAFFGRAARAGTRWLLDFSDHLGRVVALVGILIGVSVAGFARENEILNAEAAPARSALGAPSN